ncbi:MAG: glycosyl transferase family protein [Bermanella sp.]
MNPEHPFAQYVRILGKGRKGSRSLTYDEALAAMTMILNGECEDVQLGAFMMLLRVKEESAEELAGFTQATKNHIKPQVPAALNVDLDWSSYAGKRRHLPWYLLASFVLADNGFRVFMHGADGHTAGRVYTRQALKELNVQTANNWQEVEDQLAKENFSFMGMEHLCPPLQDIIDLRGTFGLRSPVHSFARLLNPLNSKHVSQGVFHPGYGPSHQLGAKLLGYERLSIIKGEGGECECNPDSPFKMHHCFNEELIEEEWPAIFAKRHVKPKTLELSELKPVWTGEIENEYGEGAIIGTLAYVARLMGHTTSQQDCMTLAKQWWHKRNIARFN